MSDSNNTESTTLVMMKELAKVGLGCVVGVVIGYTICKLTNRSDNNRNIAKDPSVINYVAREGNVYIKQLSDIRLTTETRFPDKAHYLTPVSQCYFIKWLVSTLNVRKAIEIGIFTGSTSLCIGLGIRSVATYDATHNRTNLENGKNLYNESDYGLISINFDISQYEKCNNLKLSKNIHNNNSKKTDITASFDDLTDLASDTKHNNNNNSNDSKEEEEINRKNNEMFLNIANKAWKSAEISDLITLETNPTNNVIDVLSNLYINEANHKSFDFAFINYADIRSFKEYYTLLMRLIRENGIILISHTLGECINKHHKNGNGNGSVLVSDNKIHNELIDGLRSFNHKIVSDSNEKNLIDCCMITFDNNTSMTLIRKSKKNPNIESSSSLLRSGRGGDKHEW